MAYENYLFQQVVTAMAFSLIPTLVCLLILLVPCSSSMYRSKGEQCTNCCAGPPGAPGIHGSHGQPGATGNPGSKGERGEKGYLGDTGTLYFYFLTLILPSLTLSQTSPGFYMSAVQDF